MHLRSSLRLGLAATGAATILLLSACGSSGSSSSPTTAAAATPTTVSAGASETTAVGATPTDSTGGRRGAGMEAAITAFTDCLTQQGISVPEVSFPAGNRQGGDGGPPADGSRPAGAPTGSFPGRTGGQGGAGGGNAGNGGGFDPTTMIIQRLGLDTSDAAVKAAVDACTPALTAALPTGGAPGGQPPADAPTTTAG